MINSWQYSTTHNCTCKIIEEQTLWGETVCRVWLPSQNILVRVSKSSLRSLSSELQPDIEQNRIAYVSAAAKVAEIIEGSINNNGENILLAPMESNVIPLPHQIHALSRAVSGDRVRYLLADEVGLGKTIEAGLIMKELKLRGLVRRVLIVAPKSLAMQWVAEMNTHFNEFFSLVEPGDIEAVERLEKHESFYSEDSKKDYNPWTKYSQVIVTLDAVKPLSKRRGWSKEKINEYNANRYEKLIHGQWDLIIVDESHRLGGSTDQVARYKLGQGLAESATYLLLLSATPHQGKADAFQRLMSLLDPMTFPDLESVTRRRVANFVIRTEKRNAVTATGEPLFLPRVTKTLKVDLSNNQQQVDLYNEVTNYVKEGYNKAIKDHKPHVGFLMVLLQRIAASSTYAIRCTLERRLQVLKDLQFKNESFNEIDLDLLSELDGQELLDQLVEINEPGRVNEVERVNFLLTLAKQAEDSGPDAKTNALLDLIYQLQGEESDVDLKLLIFTEFVPTQKILKEYLENRGIICVTLNGSMSMDERRVAQKDFRDKARVLISTDAGGEGLNLQFCHVVINYDLPWNPMRIEQRIGRVDRIGQNKIVRAVNFVYANSVEDRVREVLEKKLAIIFSQMGIDKTEDVLDTSLSGEMIERMMTRVIMADADPNNEVDKTITQLKSEMMTVKQDCTVYEVSDKPDLNVAEKLRTHPLPHWVERMTVSFIRMNRCQAVKNLFGWDLSWPNGQNDKNIEFYFQNISSENRLLTLENNRIRELSQNIPQIVYGQSIPCLHIESLPATVKGIWGLFEIKIQSSFDTHNLLIKIPNLRRVFFCVFVSEEGSVYLPTARRIWDILQTTDFKIDGFTKIDESITIYDQLSKVAESVGEKLYQELKQRHTAAISFEENRGKVAFAAKRRAIEKIGLPEVRHYRMEKCQVEENNWKNELASVGEIMPEIRPLLMLKIEEK